METSINIADLIKPKFEVGQDVWIVDRDYNSRISRIYLHRVSAINFRVEIEQDRQGKEVRKTKLEYVGVNGAGPWVEGQLLASLDDIPAADRAARG